MARSLSFMHSASANARWTRGGRLASRLTPFASTKKNLAWLARSISGFVFCLLASSIWRPQRVKSVKRQVVGETSSLYLCLEKEEEMEVGGR